MQTQRIFTDEPVHSMRFDLKPDDYASASDELLDAFQWAATKASERDAAEGIRLKNEHGAYTRAWLKLLGYAKEWENIADNCADELRSRNVRPIGG